MTKTKLKKKVWKLFSEYIRRRGAKPSGITKCVTCGKKDHWKKLQAGHFIHGRTNAILFHEKLVWPQCFRCNVKLHGNTLAYLDFMLEKYGQDEVDELRRFANTSVSFSIESLEDLAYKYHRLINSMGA